MYKLFSKPISKSEKRILTSAALFCASALVVTGGFDAILRAAPSATPIALMSTTRNPAIWATYKGDAQRTGEANTAAKFPMSLLWRYTSDVDPSAIAGSPIVVGAADSRRVLFNAGNTLICLDAESGEEVWKFKGDGLLRAPLSLLPNGANDTVLTLSTKGTAYAVRINDGSVLWNYKADGPLRVAPLAVRTTRGDRVLIPSASGALVALTLQGTVDTAWKVAISGAPAANPVVSRSGERIFIVSDDGNLYGIDVRGARVAFSVPLGDRVTVTPVAVGNSVVAASANALIAFRADNGTVLWRASAGDETFTTLAAQTSTLPNSNDVIYSGTNRGSMMAFSARDGKMLWKSTVGRANLSGSPLVLPGVILVGGRDGVFYGIDSKTGAKRWSYRLESERRVLVQVRDINNNGSGNSGGISRNSRSGGSGTGGISGGARATPTPKIYQTQSFGTSGAPAAVDGHVYVTADNSALYAFAAEGGYDAAAPITGETALVIPDVDDKPFPVPITAGFRGIPAYGPISMTVKLSDVGSGIDASTIRAAFDGTPLDDKDARFDFATGTLTLSLFKMRGATNLLSDGPHTVTVEVADNSGNRMPTATTTFTVDQTFQSPTANNNNNNNGNRTYNGGRGGRGNGGPGGFGGGNPGGFNPGGYNPGVRN